MKKQFKLGAEYNLIQKPLLFALREGLLEHSFDLVMQPSRETLQGLLHGELDAGFITPLQYARNSVQLSLCPDTAVLSAGPCGWAGLLFRENLTRFDQVAVWPDSQLYQSLAGILFRENYELDLEWQILETLSEPEKVLEKYPGVLLSGEPALVAAAKLDNLLDLCELWWEKTDSAFFHYLLAAPRENSGALPLEQLRLARSLGVHNLNRIARTHAEQQKGTLNWVYYLERLQNGFGLEPAPAHWEGMRLYFEYLFYHGRIDYLPDVHFFDR